MEVVDILILDLLNFYTLRRIILQYLRLCAVKISHYRSDLVGVAVLAVVEVVAASIGEDDILGCLEKHGKFGGIDVVVEDDEAVDGGVLLCVEEGEIGEGFLLEMGGKGHEKVK